MATPTRAAARQHTRSTGTALLLVFLTGFVLRFNGLSEPQLWVDELIQLVNTSAPTLLENLRLMAGQVAVVPLDPLVQSVFVGFLGPWEAGARLHAAIAGVLTLPLIFALARRLLGRDAALMSALLLSVYPLHVFYSREGRNYSFFCLLTTLSFLLLLSALRQNRAKDWWLFGATTTLLLYSNYLAVLVPITQGVILAALLAGRRFLPDAQVWLRPTLSALKGFTVAAGGAYLLFLPWLLLTFRNARWNASEELLTKESGMRIWKELSGGSLPLSVLLTLLVLIGVTSLLARRRSAELVLLSCWSLLPFVGLLLLLWWRQYYFAIRQTLFLTPALLMLAAAGLETLRAGRWRIVRWSSVLALTAVLTLSIGTLVVSDRKQHADWKGLTAYLEQTGDSERVCAPRIESIIAFRYPRFGSQAVDPETLERALQAASAPPLDPLEVRVHVVISRFLEAGESERLLALVRRRPAARTTQLMGFEVHEIAVPGGVPDAQ